MLRLLIATLLVGLASGSSCVDTCSTPSLCDPITKPLAAKETLVFTTLSSADWKSYDWTKITTLAIFVSGGDDAAVAEVTCLAHAFGVRVVKGEQFPMDDIYDNDAMKAFIDSKVDEAKRLGLDGLNFDNEGLTGTADILAQRIHEVKVAFEAEFEAPQISFDLSIFPKNGQGDGYDFTRMNDDLDFQLPMAYDMCWGAKVATANSPINSNVVGLQQYVDLGVPASNVVLGLPWYGWAYKCTGDSAANSTEPCTVQDYVTDWYGEVAFQWGLDTITAAWNDNGQPPITLDESTQTKFFTYIDSSTSSPMQCWFDDHETLSKKYQIAEEYRGIALWTSDMVRIGGSNYDDMWDALPVRN